MSRPGSWTGRLRCAGHVYSSDYRQRCRDGMGELSSLKTVFARPM
ncbi:hypothetical protein SLI_7368 [Streptomyces lividans 1326]|uniref:Uncharacterized protein n=1 Tax=Streptomyces lividans 1326 TaxID=1200984 RepID=A0A7U9E1W0_STRLI|nr:hypothetical protein SLI_7368 [Streptomyces lividans 1326]